MPPVPVDVITPLPEGWGLCVTCEAFLSQAGVGGERRERSLESFPPDWQADFIRLSDFVQTISQTYGSQVVIRLYDPRSIQGLAKAIRFGVRRYPTFVVAEKAKIIGLEADLFNLAMRTALKQAEGAHENS